MERILRQQREAKLAAAAAEAERLQKEEDIRNKERLEAKQRAADSEQASLMSRESQATLFPEAAASQFMKSFQNIKNKLTTGPSGTLPPPIPRDLKPSIEQQTSNDFAMNQKYLSSAKQEKGPSDVGDHNVNMPGEIPGAFPTKPKRTGPASATPLNDICRFFTISVCGEIKTICEQQGTFS